MPGTIGFFTSSGSPAVKISIYGVFPNLSKEFDAIIDTGFTGFLSMPLVQAFPLGLVLFGTTNVVLADGSTAYRLTAYGHAKLGDHDKSGIIILEPNSTDVLIGMDFLVGFAQTLFIVGERVAVALVDNEDVVEAVKKLATGTQKGQKEQEGSPGSPPGG